MNTTKILSSHHYSPLRAPATAIKLLTVSHERRGYRVTVCRPFAEEYRPRTKLFANIEDARNSWRAINRHFLDNGLVREDQL